MMEKSLQMSCPTQNEYHEMALKLNGSHVITQNF